MSRPTAVVAAAVAATAVFVPSARAGGVPVQLADSPTTLWAASDSGLHAVDPLTGRARPAPRTTYPYATEVVVGGGAAWIASIRNGYTAGAVDRLDLKTGRRTVALRSPHRGIYGIAYAAHTLWVLLAQPVSPLRFEVARLDGGSIRYFRLGGQPGWIAAGRDGLWVSGNSLRFMARDGSVSRIAPGVAAGLLTTGGGSVWVGSRHSLLRFDEHRPHRRLTTLHLGAPITALTAAAGRVWVTVAPTSGASDRLLRIDARTGRITGRRVLSHPSEEPASIAADRAHVWLGINGTYKQRIVRLDARSLAREQVFALR